MGDRIRQDFGEAIRWTLCVVEPIDRYRNVDVEEWDVRGYRVGPGPEEMKLRLFAAYQAAAESGYEPAFRNILDCYLGGRFGPADDVTILMWCILYAPWWERVDRLTWRKADDRMEKVIARVTVDQVGQAKRRASEWKAIHRKTR